MAGTKGCVFTGLALLASIVHALPSLPTFNNDQKPLRNVAVSAHREDSETFLKPNYEKFLECSLTNYKETGFPFLQWAKPLPASAFIKRRDRAAAALHREGLEALVIEPGYSFKYYGNFSQPDWESWEPEERPMLMVIQPVKDAETGAIKANTTFLVAAFEEGRLKLLDIPLEGSIQTITWQEHWSPYKTLLHANIWKSHSPKIMVDEDVRDFISRGLHESGFDVKGLGGEVERVRQTKTTQEIEIMRAVNTGTVSAIREMRKCLVPGLTGNQVRDALSATLRSAGMEPYFNLVAFGTQAASPHGGLGGAMKLTDEDLILIDVGARLHSFLSDITRTFFPPFVVKPKEDELTEKMKEQLKVWHTVRKAQNAAIDAMVANASCASVDIAARTIIEDAGYGQYFTHRLGHSIGLRGHESPYLNKGNVDTKLTPGMLFTSEPGIYIWDKLGVRLEDVILVTEGREAECLSCGSDGNRPTSPWQI